MFSKHINKVNVCLIDLQQFFKLKEWINIKLLTACHRISFLSHFCCSLTIVKTAPAQGQNTTKVVHALQCSQECSDLYMKKLNNLSTNDGSAQRSHNRWRAQRRLLSPVYSPALTSFPWRLESPSHLPHTDNRPLTNVNTPVTLSKELVTEAFWWSLGFKPLFGPVYLLKFCATDYCSIQNQRNKT